MTKEEAKQALKDLADMNVRHGCDDKWITALNMAIEALSAKPQTDYISRADAIEAVAQQWLFEASVGNPYVNDDDIGEYRKLAEELFEDVPSADAEMRDATAEERASVQRYIDSISTEAVQVVRCKDCKWAEKAILDEYCVECTMYHTSCMKHGYCHHGERREP